MHEDNKQEAFSKDHYLFLTKSKRNRGIISHDKELEQIIDSNVFKFKMNELRLLRRYEGRPQDMKVTIIMPTWNRAFIIGRAVESVLQQTYGNFELIIVDDGSTDGTGQYLEKNYIDRRIEYIEDGHVGVSHARNTALARSTGQIIAYLDTDNAWSEHYLLLMVGSFADRPNIDTMYCRARVLDNINKIDYIRLHPYDRNRLLEANYIDLNIFMHRRSLFEECGGFNEDLTALVDWDLILRYTEHHPPHVLECNLATYHLEKEYGHISLNKDATAQHEKVKRLHEKRRH